MTYGLCFHFTPLWQKAQNLKSLKSVNTNNSNNDDNSNTAVASDEDDKVLASVTSVYMQSWQNMQNSTLQSATTAQMSLSTPCYMKIRKTTLTFFILKLFQFFDCCFRRCTKFVKLVCVLFLKTPLLSPVTFLLIFLKLQSKRTKLMINMFILTLSLTYYVQKTNSHVFNGS
jgi:hypothetical protein